MLNDGIILWRFRLGKTCKKETMEALILFFKMRQSREGGDIKFRGEKGNEEEFVKAGGGHEGIHSRSRNLLLLCFLIFFILNLLQLCFSFFCLRL